MNALRRVLGRHSDIALVALVIGVMTVLFTPIPSSLLDLLILGNFSFALLLLLLTFYMQRPVDFSTFPSLLLIATLFRLSLNVAATRLILSDADAGRVIASVGSFVVGGNYVIGLIVFLILVVVQYVVVTSGAQRVSEVAARFTLDSMPGQQMSIDADLNMGFIDQAEAQRRRKNLEKEAAFYGAMDGASKFVKGDAIAGIVILLINIVGGLVIGVMQLQMSWGQALQTFTLLTIGDGIVTQVPALVIAVGTGILVTRSASDHHLSAEVLRQVTSHPKAMLLVMAALLALLALPGIPVWPGLVLLALLGTAAWLAAQRDAPNEPPAAAQADGAAPTGPAGDPYSTMKIEPWELRVGGALSALARADGAMLAERIAAFRQQLALDLGVVVPKLAVASHPRLAPQAYDIHLHGVHIGRGEVHLDRLLAIHPAGDTKLVAGIETREPTYGLAAVWIEESQRDAARAARYTLVDPATVVMTHLSESLKQHAPGLMTRAEVDRMMQRVRQAQPGLVEELVPTQLPLGDVQKVLQHLLREKVSVRHLEAVIETLVDASRATKDPALLAEAVRQRLGPAICQQLLGDAGALQVLTLDPAVEQALAQQMRQVDPQSGLVLEPRLADQLIAKVAGFAEQMMRANLLPVLLCTPELRRHLRTLLERAVPHMRVLALTEVPNSVPLQSFGSVSVPPLPAPGAS